jgi:hypothetical protein
MGDQFDLAWAAVPKPPGMKRMWMGSRGGAANVWVGTICCSKGLLFWLGDMVSVEVGRVDTGERVEERMESWRGREG